MPVNYDVEKIGANMKIKLAVMSGWFGGLNHVEMVEQVAAYGFHAFENLGAGKWEDKEAGNMKWHRKLYPFVNNERSFWLCPDSPAPRLAQDSSGASGTGPEDAMNIGINIANGSKESSFYLEKVKQTEIRTPSALMYSGDGAGKHAGSYYPANGNGACPLSAGIYPNIVSGWVMRHNNGSNVLYADGHVKNVNRNTFDHLLANIWRSEKPSWFVRY